MHTPMRPRKLLRLYKKEKDPDIRDRMWLNILVERDGMSATGAVVHMEKARSWGSTWRRRYLDEGAEGLRTRPRSGRPSRIPGEAMSRIRQKIEQEDCWTVEALYGLIKLEAGVEYDPSYVRRLLRNLRYVRKVPLRRHVRRANRWKVAWFRRKTRTLIKARRHRGWTVGIQDESVFVAEARPRKSVYSRKGKRPTITYGGDHSRTVVFGVITCDGRSLFKRYDRFTKDEFADFLRHVRLKFGRTLIIADRAPQHRAAAVREALAEMKGRVELWFLPPGCPELSAIEEVWRQMKRAILDVPYVTLARMCEGIDRWAESSVPVLDIEKYLYGIV